MRVVIEPTKSPAYMPRITGPVVVRHSIRGGASTADIPAELTPAQKDRSLFARVRVFGRDSCCWEGVVWGVDPLEVVGIGTVHSFGGSASCYATNNLEPWRERTVTARAPWINVESDANALRFFIESGDAVEVSRYNGLWRIIEPVPSSAYVTFSWSLPGYANWSLSLWTGSQPSAASAEVAGSWTNRWTDPRNANSGTATVTINAAFDTLLFQLTSMNAYTASGTTEASVSNLKIYGRNDQMATARVDDFLKAMVADLPSWAYPEASSSPASRRWIMTDSTEVWPLEFKAVSNGVKIGEVIDRLGGNKVYAWIAGGRIAGTERTRLVPAYWSIPATPSFYVDLKNAIDWEFDPQTLEQMADSVVAEYNTPDNQEPGLFYLTTDDAPLNLLYSYIGRSKREFISTRATTASGAQAAAQANLSLRSKLSCRGTITTAEIFESGSGGAGKTGALTPVESVLPGYRVGILGHPSGEVLTPIITEIETDGTQIKLTVDSRPYGER